MFWAPDGWRIHLYRTHLFYCRAFEQKNKNLTRDFYFFAQMLLNLFSIRDKYFFSHMRKNIFISYEKKNIYLICCKIDHCKTLNHMAQAYSTLVVLVMSCLIFFSKYFWRQKIATHWQTKHTVLLNVTWSCWYLTTSTYLCTI